MTAETCKCGQCQEAVAAGAARRAGDPKPTNPKDACGIKKAYASTVPSPFVLEVGLAMLEGARKYGRHNYRVTGVRASVYYDAAIRHLTAWWEGQDIDPASGLHHCIKAAACMAVLRDAQRTGKYIDDRPPKLPDDWQEALNKTAEEIIAKHPESKPPCTEKP